MLTAASVKVNANSRIRLLESEDTDKNSYQTNSYNLEITDVREIDAGSYACQIGTIIPKETVHHLEILGMI